MNPALRATFDWLRSQGLPPLSVAPAQDPTRYPARNRDGSLKRDKEGALVPAFTGKNPSYVDSRGIPHLIRHTQYQNRMPTQAELQTWFANPDNGIGTLGGWHNIVWIDVDVKQFDSQQACDQRIADWLGQYPLLQQTFTERTHSGGWRLAVRAYEKSFTNFSLDGVGGQHMGEALGQGHFTVLAPTIGPSGNAYVNVQRVPPIWVERLDAVGLYPVSGRREQGLFRQSRPRIQSQPAQPGVLRLEDLATAKAQAVLHGDSPLESRSHSLTYALREFYGWENWAAQNRVLISGNAEELVRAAGAALGIDAERVERIMESITDPASCTPAAVFTGGETSAWKRVWKLDRQVYEELCPSNMKQSIQTIASENHHVLTGGKPQKKQNAGVQAPAVYNPAISADQIQAFVRQAWSILAHAYQTERGNVSVKRSTVDPKVWVQGQIYRIAAEGPQLTVEARERGAILQAQGDTVTLENLTIVDLKRFQAEMLRLQQRHRPCATAPAISHQGQER
ncbi:bifunctional DNA primase/polymerase [Leptolyngbya sp. KIOST-1]|uniref:bifunctional DNA primase/polymerase n=1 Tax=Cyanophyceae TaxID=3028117 RepID=UPI00055C2B81|nr:bifunctional DNA primase/polymerase [Leptolyngbya sp. KIOST-1]